MNIPALRQFWTLCNSGCGTVPTSPIGWSDRMIPLDGTIGPGPRNPSITRFDIMNKKGCPQRYVVVPWQVNGSYGVDITEFQRFWREIFTKGIS